jgi:hypothetical protein
MLSDDLLARLRSAQLAAGPRELRIILELAQGQEPEAVRAELGRRLPLVFRFGALFAGPFGEGPDPALDRFWLLRLPGVDEAAFAGDVFDLARGLDDDLGLAGAEPDLDPEHFPMPESALGCEVNPPEPEDRAWQLRIMRVPDAWAFSTGQGRTPRGRDVRIAQIDTGYTPHPELEDALELASAFDFYDGDPDPRDPLLTGLGRQPGHGTATASVAVSRGDVEALQNGVESGTTGGRVTGSAPEAVLVPLRAVDSVILLGFAPSRVARAVEHARRTGCHVVTMSLGGQPSIALGAAIRRAVKDDVIVMAAAGNCVGEVVFPARLDLCLGIGGSNPRDQPWQGSCRGAEIDVCAPGEAVWRALAGGEVSGTGEGTSYAVALTAGVAALWLAHHGREALRQVARGRDLTLQGLFARLLKATARSPAGWDTSRFGTGVVDALGLLQRDPASVPLDLPGPEAALERPHVADEVAFARALVGDATAAALGPDRLARHAQELVWLGLRARVRALGPGGRPEAALPTPVLLPVPVPISAGIARLRDEFPALRAPLGL